MKVFTTVKNKDLQKYGFLFDTVSKDNIEDTFIKILNYQMIQSCLNDHFIKTAQMARTAPQQYQPNIGEWFRRGKNVDWLSKKYEVSPLGIEKTLDKSIGPKWKTIEEKRNQPKKIPSRIEKSVLFKAYKKHNDNKAVSALEIARALKIKPRDVMDILEKNDFPGRLLGRSESITPDIIKLVVETQKKQIEKGQPLGSAQLVKIVEKKLKRKISTQTIIRILASAGLKAKGQTRDPILTDLLNKFWSKFNKGFWSTLSGMNEMTQMKTINDAIDSTFANYDENRMMKQYFLTNKIQIRDALLNRPGSNPQQNAQVLQVNPQIKQQILQLNNSGIGSRAISNRTGVEIAIINEILKTNQWQNFQLDPNHPSNILGNDIQ